MSPIESAIRLWLMMPLPMNWYSYSLEQKRNYVRRLIKNGYHLSGCEPYFYRTKTTPDEVLKECFGIPSECISKSLKRQITKVLRDANHWLESSRVRLRGYKETYGFRFDRSIDRDAYGEKEWKEFAKEHRKTLATNYNSFSDFFTGNRIRSETQNAPHSTRAMLSVGDPHDVKTEKEPQEKEEEM